MSGSFDPRQSNLDGLGAQVRTIAAGSPVEAAAEAFAAMLQSGPLVAVRGDPTTAERVAALLAPSFPDLTVTVDEQQHRPAADAVGALADWWVVVTPAFALHDPIALDVLRQRCAAPSRTTVLVDTALADRMLADTVLVDSVLAGASGHGGDLGDPGGEAILRLVARRVLPVSVDLWSRAVATTDADSRALAALAIGGEGLVDDLANASSFLRRDVGRAAEVRSRLFDRLGMRGLRCALAEPNASLGADALRAALLREAGADRALAAISSDLHAAWPAARELRAVAATTSLVDSMRAHDRRRARDMTEALQRFEQGSEATMADVLRRWHAVAAVPLRPDLQTDIDRIVDGSTMRDRIGVDASASNGDALVIASAGVKRWRAFAAGPLVASPVAAFADTVAQWFEIACATLTSSPG